MAARGFTPLRAKDLAELSWALLGWQWSPIVFRGGHRHQTQFLSSDVLALDFDDPEFQLADAKHAFAGLEYLIGTTRHHQMEKHGVTCDRFRVVIPWSVRITSLELYRYNIRLALEMYEHADSACKDGARGFYPCTNILAIEEGERWDVVHLPKVLRNEPKTHGLTRLPKGYLPSRAKEWLNSEIPKGRRSDTLYKLGCALARAGFDLDESIEIVLRTPTLASVKSDANLTQRYMDSVRNGFVREKNEGGSPPLKTLG